jgi:hypothetical protein
VQVIIQFSGTEELFREDVLESGGVTPLISKLLHHQV